MPNDIAISSIGVPTNTPTRSRPYYLITLTDVVHTAKGVKSVETFFISQDRPTLEQGFVGAKGIYSALAEDVIVKGFSDIMAQAPKDSVLEMMFPTHRVKHIRSLIFNAVKPTMVAR
jgi:hypothetical protein